MKPSQQPLSFDDDVDDLPILGPVPRNMSDREREKRQLNVSYTASQVFDIQDEASRGEFDKVITEFYSGRVRILYRSKLFGEGNRFIYIIWVENFITYSSGRASMPQRLFQASPHRTVTATQALLSTAGQMAAETMSMTRELEGSRVEDEDDEDDPKEKPTYRARSGIFDILDSEQMKVFHTHLDRTLDGQCLSDHLAIQYDQEMRLIHFVWVEVTKTPIPKRGW